MRRYTISFPSVRVALDCGALFVPPYIYFSLHQDLNKAPPTEAPGSWRTSLRKAGSSVTLGSAGLGDAHQDPRGPSDSRLGLGMTRSASSPRLSSEAEAKVQRPLPVPGSMSFTPPERYFSLILPSFLTRSPGWPGSHPFPPGDSLVFPTAAPTTTPPTGGAVAPC